MKIEKAISIIFMSLVICAFAGIFGLFFNIFNPYGISLLPKKEVKKIEAVKPEKKVTAKPIPVKNPENKIVTSVQKIKPPAVETKEVQKPADNEIRPPVVEEKKPATSETPVVDERKIDIVKAKKIFDSGKAVFLDARPEFAYMERHVKGAISLSASRFGFQYEQIKDKLKKDDLYVIYCSSPTCHLSDLVAEDLKEKGFTNLKVFVGGWDEWNSAGYPIAGLKVRNGEGGSE